jgi:hypothetical protein
VQGFQETVLKSREISWRLSIAKKSVFLQSPISYLAIHTMKLSLLSGINQDRNEEGI